MRGGLTVKSRKRPSPELWKKLERLIIDLLQEEGIPEQERFDGLILAMRAHGLPCDPERVEKIRKCWNECVASRRQRRGKT